MKKTSGRYFDKSLGYWKVKVLGHPSVAHLDKRHQYVLEHRLVMEKILGRYLTSDEFVLHKDGDLENNSDNNLILGDSKTQNKTHKRIKKFIKKGGKMPVSWSKGKTKKEFPKMARRGVKKGNVPWNKDLKYKHRSTKK